jgi:ABC-type multidrug transport system ATPase subunit
MASRLVLPFKTRLMAENSAQSASLYDNLLQMSSTSARDVDSGSPFSRGLSFRAIFKLFFKFCILLRKRDKSYIPLLILGMAMNVGYLNGMSVKSIDTDDQPNPNATLLGDPRVPLLLVPSERVAMAPDSNFSRRIVANLTADLGKVFISDEDEKVCDYVSSGNSPDGLGYVFGDGEPEELQPFNFTSVVKVEGGIGSEVLLSGFADQVYRGMGIETALGSRPYAHPPTRFVVSIVSVYAFYFVYAMVLPAIWGVASRAKLGEKRIWFLLEAFGLSGIVRVSTWVLVSFLENLLYGVLATVLFVVVPLTSGTNAILFLFSHCLMSLGFIFMGITLGQFIRTQKSAGPVVLIFLFTALTSQVIVVLQQYIPKAVVVIFHLTNPFSPFFGLTDLAIKAKVVGDPLTWSNLDFAAPISGSVVLGCQVVTLFIWFVITVVVELVGPRTFGQPPFRFKHLFQLSKWKSIFRRSARALVQDPDEAIRLEGVSKVYSGKQETVALNDVSLTIRTGEILIAIGANGAGKSTLINTLIGAIPKTSGRLYAFGDEIEQDFSELYRCLGLVFQDDTIIEDITCREHFELFSGLRGYTPAETEQDLSSLSSMLKLTECLDTRAKDLSGGEKRKLCIALSLISRPSILIFDEPTAGVDAQSRQIIWKAISHFEGITAFISCHSLEEAESVATRFLVMRDGAVAFIGTSAELRSQYRCGYHVTFLDDPPNMEAILERAETIVPEVHIRQEHPPTLFIPVDLRAADVLAALEEAKEELGFTRYAVRLENLEETLAKLIEDAEAVVARS